MNDQTAAGRSTGTQTDSQTGTRRTPTTQAQAQMTVSGCVMKGTGANEFTLGRVTGAGWVLPCTGDCVGA